MFERRRLLIGIAIAVALHVTLGLAWWLTPPLRLKAGIDPHRWVQVVSIPKLEPPAPPLQTPSPAKEPRKPHSDHRR